MPEMEEKHAEAFEQTAAAGIIKLPSNATSSSEHRQDVISEDTTEERQEGQREICSLLILTLKKTWLL